MNGVGILRESINMTSDYAYYITEFPIVQYQISCFCIVKMAIIYGVIKTSIVNYS